jgi:excisionase family DNA binding protein
MTMADRRNNLSVMEAAQQAGVSVFTMRAWIRQRRIAHVRLGRRVLIAMSDLERFIEMNRVEATPR